MQYKILSSKYQLLIQHRAHAYSRETVLSGLIVSGPTLTKFLLCFWEQH